MCNLSSKVFARKNCKGLTFSLYSPIHWHAFVMQNTTFCVTVYRSDVQSELHRVGKSYWKILLLHVYCKLSTNYLHADPMLGVGIWVYLCQKPFFLQPSTHMCFRETTHAFYIDVSACVQGFTFYPNISRPSSDPYVLSWNHSRTRHWWSAGANLQNGFTIFSQTW